MISIDDFRNVELKIATVKSAELHPNADKLMVLQIDLGAEQRQICAGIRNHYTPEELVGKQVVVVANLETAKLRGLESQGMLLAVSDEGRVIILTPEKSVLAGAKVPPERDQAPAPVPLTVSVRPALIATVPAV